MSDKLITKSFERLLEKGKTRGFITYEELGKSLGKRGGSVENTENAFIIIVENSITLVEKKSQYQSNKKKDGSSSTEEKSTEKSDDPIRMYLREMGGVELLSREGEIAIAKRIEAGKDVMINALTQSPLVAKKILEWKELIEGDQLLVRDIIDIAIDNFGCLLSISANSRFSAFKKHLAEQLYKGGGTYFKCISAEDRKYMFVDYAAEGGTNRSPTDFLKSQCYAFSKFWQPKSAEAEQSVLNANLIAYRQYALENVDSSQHTPYNYKQTIKHYNNNTRGSDSWHMSTLKELPDVCISSIADAIKQSVDEVAVPHQSLCSLNACLGKPSGGLRTISKLPMTNRLYNKVSNNVVNWEKQIIANACGPYETAKKGCSALDAALYRNVVKSWQMLIYWKRLFNYLRKIH